MNTREALYRFHKALNRPFPGAEALAAHALELLSRHVPVERLSYFRLAVPDMVLTLRLCLRAGRRQEIDEEIHVLDDSPLGRLLEGGRERLSYVSPHPILYVPLRAQSLPGVKQPVESKGVLRLERSGRRRFTDAEQSIAALFAAEFAQNLHQAELAHRSREQLKRLEALTELTAIFATSLRVDDGLKLILQGIQRHFSLDRVRLYLVAPAGPQPAGTAREEHGLRAERGPKVLRGELSVDMHGRVESLRREEMPLTPGEHRFVDLLLRAASDPMLERYRQTVLHVPLTVQGNGIGLLVVDNLVSQEPIGPEDVELLKSFAGQIALAVDNARLFDEVQALSLYDGLTRLPVRRYFNQRFHEEIYRAQRSGQPLSLALMDLDHFKSINDTYGHQIGDQVLTRVGSAILAGLRKIDFPCRWGGDELALLLPQCGEEDAARILGRVAAEIRGVRVPVPFSKAVEVGITASVGVAVYPADGRMLEDLLAKADEALYWVKSKGRDGVVTFGQVTRASGPAGQT